MTTRRQCLLPMEVVVLVVLVSFIMSSFSLAQPQEKVATVHHTSRKRTDGHRSWNHQQIIKVLQHVDIESLHRTPMSSSLASSVPVSVVTLPSYLDVLPLSPCSSSSSAAVAAAVASRFRVGTWRFLVNDKKSAHDTTTVSGIALQENSSVAGRRTPLAQDQIAAAPTNQKYRSLSHAHLINNYNSIWKRLRDDFSFKGYGISLYKSLMAFNKAGIAFRIPLLNHWDWWDSNPALPSTNLLLCMYYPFNLSVGLTSSMRTDVLKCWFTKSVYMTQAAILQFLHHLLSALWIIVSLLLYPLQRKWRPAPWQLDQQAAQAAAKSRDVSASYQSEIQERLGTTLWYRWTPAVGFDSRISFWHLYMPTLEVYSQFLTGSKERLLGTWWKSHFASLGLDSAVSNAMFSATGVLSLSGLRFERGRIKGKMPDRPLEVETLKFPQGSTNAANDKSSFWSSDVDVKTTKATLSTILQEDRDNYEDNDELSKSTRLKVMRGGNTTAIVTNHTTSCTQTREH